MVHVYFCEHTFNQMSKFRNTLNGNIVILTKFSFQQLIVQPGIRISSKLQFRFSAPLQTTPMLVIRYW